MGLDPKLHPDARPFLSIGFYHPAKLVTDRGRMFLFSRTIFHDPGQASRPHGRFPGRRRNAGGDACNRAASDSLPPYVRVCPVDHILRPFHGIFRGRLSGPDGDRNRGSRPHRDAGESMDKGRSCGSPAHRDRYADRLRPPTLASGYRHSAQQLPDAGANRNALLGTDSREHLAVAVTIEQARGPVGQEFLFLLLAARAGHRFLQRSVSPTPARFPHYVRHTYVHSHLCGFHPVVSMLRRALEYIHTAQIPIQREVGGSSGNLVQVSLNPYDFHAGTSALTRSLNPVTRRYTRVWQR